jgi:hypothetical protein
MRNYVLLLVLAALSASVSADERGPRRHGQGPRWEHGVQPMAPGGMSWEERQRLRDELKSGRREGWRQEWRGAQADPRRGAPPMAPEERERLRRDLREVNREMQGRR